MYFAYGWPRVLGFDVAGDALSSSCPDQNSQNIVQLLSDDSVIIAITAGGIQVWSGGQHRVILSKRSRSDGDVHTEGAYHRAYWSASRRLLAVVVNPSPVDN